ncbi:hypothetical protein GOP47_0007028 [Adiantum capillus-veneris]|uniref:Cytochrome P450 n=1 Tax=Adiantum capillus-veneris TaxID=13818 RepID=A0A9D4V056_ADICA|nr:hypothetical protein GOP47_0007028 [Adiantum capillus-veneris]
MDWEVANTTTSWAALAVVVVAVAWVARMANEWWYLPSPSAIPPGSKLPPGSLGWPFIGGMLSFVRLFKRDPEAYFRRHFLSRYKGHSDGIYKAHLFGSPCIITCSPEMNKFVLGHQGDGSTFASGWPTPKVVGPSCMVVVEGAQHKRMRKLLTDAITHPLPLRRSLLRQERRFTNALAQWAHEKNIILGDKLKQVTFEEICDSFLSLNSGPLVKKMLGFTRGLVGGVRAFPINIPGFTYYNALQCRKSMTEIMHSIIQDRRNAGIKAEDEDFLDVLLEVRDEEGKCLIDDEISDNIISFLLAGHESIAYTLLWTMVFLAKNTKVLNKLRMEHMSLRSKKEGDWIADLKKSPYTNFVLDEVLRRISVSPMLFRTVKKEGINYKGYYFPKGWKVVAWLRASHMDSNLFTDPDNFDPDRFIEPPRSGFYMPFGHGPRLCPGNTLALLSSRLFIHILLTNYKWSLVNPDAPVTYLPHPKPIDGGEVVLEPL